jgi:hypothetical protein
MPRLGSHWHPGRFAPLAVQPGRAPPPSFASEVVSKHVRRAIDEAILPAAVADMVAEAVAEGRFWVFTEQPFIDLVIRRWQSIAERENPDRGMDVPGMPPAAQLREEILQALGMADSD